MIFYCLLLSMVFEIYSGVGCFIFVGEFLIVLFFVDLIDELGYVGYEGCIGWGGRIGVFFCCIGGGGRFYLGGFSIVGGSRIGGSVRWDVYVIYLSFCKLK